ncbi:hypothetical protein HZS_1833 [Henneguya salminicola]|nr:hypothetical protein HZS_1833 [Henneguya salminicola]
MVPSPDKCKLAKFDKLSIEVLRQPEICSNKSKKGDKLTVHYKGMLTDGSIFDASYNRNKPFDFTVGASQVIQGWDQGLLEYKTYNYS